MGKIVCPHCGKSFTLDEAKKGRTNAEDTEELLEKAAAEMKAALSAQERQLCMEQEKIAACMRELEQKKAAHAAASAAAEEARARAAMEEKMLADELNAMRARSECLKAEVMSIRARLAEMGGENGG